ncbi:PREDICTED: KH domain-containing protein HEN4-like [Camelina sativa]|uniref:KH domain-containing protein HEN4-like n=1 Tax=Camelina sativa TaxID=90675 RepID=A0ABM1QTB4_CAMSA|nr:PREDICTED: KH domain-containing protein HEN4-like [Camelina sativa]
MEGNNSKKFESTARAPPQSSPAQSAGYVVFRILCDVSQVGVMIGKSGRVIKQLRESTQSKIWVESGPPGSLYSAVTITAHLGSTLRVKLGVTVSNASNKEKGVQEQEVEVSRAQYALIRVFEALNVGLRTSSTVSVRMLLEGSHVVTVIGKGGELLEMIWRETGCNLEIQTRDLPSFAKLGDVMMKIEGNVSAMKKALVSISSRMQACEPISIAPLRRTMNVVPREDVLGRYFGTITQPRIDSLSQRSSDHRLVNSASKNHPVTIKHPLQASEDDIRNVVLKILCPQQSVSAVIKTLQSVRDASISVSDTLSDCDERLITITASENLKDEDSPSQRAILLVFNILYDISTKKMLDSAHKLYTIARLVVGPYQVGFLLGKGGCTISEMRKITGASLNIFEVEKNPKCVSENDQVVEISGKLPQVKGAIYHVTKKLRNIATKRKVTFRPGKRITLVLQILCSRVVVLLGKPVPLSGIFELTQGPPYFWGIHLLTVMNA